MKKFTLLVSLFFLAIGAGAQVDITITESGIGLAESVPGYSERAAGDGCSQGNTAGDIAGAAGSGTESGFLAAVDVLVPAGESFTLENVITRFLTLAGLTAPTTATVTYFESDGAFPGAELGSEADIPVTVNGTAPWVNPAADVHDIEFAVTPFEFSGGATGASYWVGIQVFSGAAEGSVFFEMYDAPDGGVLVGEPIVQRNPDTLIWDYIDFGAGDGPEINAEGYYVFDGSCNPLSVDENALSQVSVFPNPTQNILNVDLPNGVDVNKLVVYDILGRDTGLSMTNGVINTSALNNGVYLLVMETNKGSFSTRIVKQ